MLLDAALLHSLTVIDRVGAYAADYEYQYGRRAAVIEHLELLNAPSHFRSPLMRHWAKLAAIILRRPDTHVGIYAVDTWGDFSRYLAVDTSDRRARFMALSAKSFFGTTLLHAVVAASSNGQSSNGQSFLSIARVLVEPGGDDFVDAPGVRLGLHNDPHSWKVGEMPLMSPAAAIIDQVGSPELLRYLLDSGADPDQIYCAHKGGNATLLEAAFTGSPDLVNGAFVDALIKSGADINRAPFRSDLAGSMLLLAIHKIKYAHTETAKRVLDAFLQAGADLSAISPAGERCLDPVGYRYASPSIEIVKWIRTQYFQEEDFVHPALTASKSVLQQFIDQAASIATTRLTALGIANLLL